MRTTNIRRLFAEHLVWIVLVLLVIIEAGYFFWWRERGQHQEIGVSVESGNVAVTIEGENPYEISKRIKAIPQPSLNKVITAPKRYPEFYQEAMKKKLASAKAILNEAPYDIVQWANVAILYENYDAFTDAEEIWKYLTEVVPEEPMYYARLAALYHYSLKDYPKAEAAYQKTLSINHLQVDQYHAFHDLHKFLYTKNIQTAISILEEGLKYNPGNLELLALIAPDYREALDNKKAYEYYSQAITAARSKGVYDLATQLERDRELVK